MAPSIPPEIWVSVFHHLSNAERASCARVARQCLVPAYWALYSSIHLGSYLRRDPPVVHEDSDTEDESSADSKKYVPLPAYTASNTVNGTVTAYNGFFSTSVIEARHLDLIQTNIGLLLKVKRQTAKLLISLLIHPYNGLRTVELHADGPVGLCALPLFPNLRTMAVERISSQTTIASPPPDLVMKTPPFPYVANLTRLTATSVAPAFVRLLLSSTPSLIEVSLVHVDLRESDGWKEWVWDHTALRKIRIETSWSISRNALWRLVQEPSEHLNVLTLSNPWNEYSGIEQHSSQYRDFFEGCNFKELIALNILGVCFEAISRLFSGQNFGKLIVLQLQEIWTQTDTYTFLRNLPPSLTYLFLDVSPTRATALATRLLYGDTHWLPKLKGMPVITVDRDFNVVERGETFRIMGEAFMQRLRQKTKDRRFPVRFDPELNARRLA